MEKRILQEIKELLEKVLEEVQELRAELEAQAPRRESLLDQSIRYLRLSQRAFNALARHFGKVPTIREVAALSLIELEEIKGVGAATFREIVEALKREGIFLKE